MAFRELARAKINLTLTVLGRRPDGYHDVVSLVAHFSLPHASNRTRYMSQHE